MNLFFVISPFYAWEMVGTTSIPHGRPADPRRKKKGKTFKFYKKSIWMSDRWPANADRRRIYMHIHLCVYIYVHVYHIHTYIYYNIQMYTCNKYIQNGTYIWHIYIYTIYYINSYMQKPTYYVRLHIFKCKSTFDAPTIAHNSSEKNNCNTRC